MGKDASYRSLKINSTFLKRQAGRIENHAFGSEFECRTGMSHTVLTGTEGIDLITLGVYAQGSSGDEYRRYQISEIHQFTIFIGLPPTNAFTLSRAMLNKRSRASVEAHAIWGLI